VKSLRNFSKIIFAAALLAAFTPPPLFACAACFGKSDSALASGMNWGIFTLMGVIVTVLASIAGFFVYIIRKEAALAAKAAAEKLLEVKA
jgi:heme/copper-type cytochrome/quinol oxidase subunit 2